MSDERLAFEAGEDQQETLRRHSRQARATPTPTKPRAPQDKIRVLVTGGRTHRDQEAVWRALDALSPDFVIQGGAEGADAAARSWAAANGVASATFHAHWSRGRGAGPQRNSAMLVYGAPTLVLKFPGGAGTEDTARQAKRRGIPVQAG